MAGWQLIPSRLRLHCGRRPCPRVQPRLPERTHALKQAHQTPRAFEGCKSRDPLLRNRRRMRQPLHAARPIRYSAPVRSTRDAGPQRRARRSQLHDGDAAGHCGQQLAAVLASAAVSERSAIAGCPPCRLVSANPFYVQPAA
eukprot:5798126-Prymnesium_polylepis.2